MVLAILSLHALLHSAYMNKPDMGVHTWRQTNTLAVAKNYYEVDMRILYPRIDKNYGTTGVTGPQFTSYDYGLACCYKLFGFSESIHRWFSLAISLLALWGAYRVFRLYLDPFISSISLLAMVGIPEFFFYSIAAVPDLLALAFMVWGWWFFYRFSERKKYAYALYAGILLALAGMTKLMFLVPGFVFLGEIIRRKWIDFPRLIGYATMAFLALAGSIWWYLWAKYLTYLNGLHEFVHQIRFLNGASEIIAAITQNIFIDAVETWIGYPLLLPVAGGLFFAIKKGLKKRQDIRISLSLVGALMYYIVMQHQLKYHGYYILLYVPFIALTVGLFLSVLRSKKWRNTVIVCAALAPIWSVVRMHHNWQVGPHSLQTEFFDKEKRETCRAISRTKPLWIVGPDQSGVINFYYLGAKGFPWYDDTKNFQNWIDWKEQGAAGVITEEPQRAMEIAANLGISLIPYRELGSFHWLIWQE